VVKRKVQSSLDSHLSHDEEAHIFILGDYLSTPSFAHCMHNELSSCLLMADTLIHRTSILTVKQRTSCISVYPTIEPSTSLSSKEIMHSEIVRPLSLTAPSDGKAPNTLVLPLYRSNYNTIPAIPHPSFLIRSRGNNLHTFLIEFVVLARVVFAS
jgi:hypothetical protein